MKSPAARINRVRACLAAGALLMAGSSVAYADGALGPYIAEYRVEISVLNGELRTQLTRSGDGFSATHLVEPTGFARLVSKGRIRDTSTFSVVGNDVRPLHFESDDSISHDGTTASIDFDWQSGQASGHVGGEDYLVPLQGVVHDRVSIQYQLMLDLLSGAEKSSYVLFDVDEQKQVSITRIGSRRISVPAGNFEAIGIQHQSEGSRRVTTLWCVRELGYLPAMIEQHRRGKLRMRAALTDYKPLRS